MGEPPAAPEELDRLEIEIDAWLADAAAANPVIEAVDRGEAGERRWYVRMSGETKDHITVWLTLAQRSLHVEAYFMPAPEENEAELFAFFLRRNATVRGLWFAIGPEDAVFLVGQAPVETLTEGVLDRLLGSTYAYVEQWFHSALSIGFASRVRP